MPTITKYPVFENNQVLTAGQLNLLASYLDEQTRISRTYLIGTGIVCGLEVTRNTPNNITISKGTGVTSEGFLIALGECVLTHYRTYEFPTGVQYPHFMQSGTTMYPILELLTTNLDSQGQVIPGVNPISGLANWQNYVVVLFLEIYDKDLYSCLGKSCDEIGIERIFTVRKLLIKKTDVDLINNKNTADAKPNKQDYRYLNQFTLDRLEMPRALLNYSNTKTPGPIIFQYAGAAAMVFEELINNCKAAYGVFELLLTKTFSQNPFNRNDLKNRINIYKDLFFEYLNGAFGFQYFYDFIYDLVIAYNEFCCAAAHLNNQYIPVEKSFPLHLMLGEISCPLSKYRQHFVSSPIINEQKEWNEKVTVLYKRIIAMLYGFAEEIEDVQKKGILITPSKEKTTRLGVRAIPVYYHPEKNTPFNYTLIDVWNEETCLPCRTNNKLPGYYAQDEIDEQDFPVSASETPLLFTINDHSFFRIEGHVGMKEKEARQTIDEIILKFNLDFNTLTLFVGKNGEVEQAKCVFSDLETDYAIWRNKMRFFLTNIVHATKKMENVSGFKSAVEKEMEYSKGSKKAGMKFKTMENTSMETEAKSSFYDSIGYKGAFLAERLNKFTAGEDTGTASTDEEELSNRISQINTCLKSLIAAMPDDLENFDFEKWCDAYRCALYKWVGIMEYIAGRLNQDLNAYTRIIFMLALTVMHFVDEFFNLVLVYPYLTIATINDTVERRMKDMEKVFTLSYQLKKNPGLEHTAGVYRGQTFVLLAFAEPEAAGKEEKKAGKWDNFAKNNNNELLQKVTQEYQEMLEKGLYEELADKYQGVVFGDLSGHLCTCDPCEDIDVDDYHVTPIAFPVTRILTPVKEINITNKKEELSYNDLRIQLLNNVYNPSVYEPFASGAVYGALSFEEKNYIPEDNKKSKILVYKPDKNKIEQAKKKLVVDSFNYNFKHKYSGEIVSSSKIYIFIHVLGVEDVKEPPGTLKGKIGINVAGKIATVAKSQIKFTVDGQTNTSYSYQQESGIYGLSLDAGDHVVKVEIPDYEAKTETVTITSQQDTTQDFIFVYVEKPAVILGNIFVNYAEIDEVKIPPKEEIEILVDGEKADYFEYDETSGDFSIDVQPGKREISIKVAGDETVKPLKITENFKSGTIKKNVKARFNLNKG